MSAQRACFSWCPLVQTLFLPLPPWLHPEGRHRDFLLKGRVFLGLTLCSCLPVGRLQGKEDQRLAGYSHKLFATSALNISCRQDTILDQGFEAGCVFTFLFDTRRGPSCTKYAKM